MGASFAASRAYQAAREGLGCTTQLPVVALGPPQGEPPSRPLQQRMQANINICVLWSTLMCNVPLSAVGVIKSMYGFDCLDDRT